MTHQRQNYERKEHQGQEGRNEVRVRACRDRSNHSFEIKHHSSRTGKSRRSAGIQRDVLRSRVCTGIDVLPNSKEFRLPVIIFSTPHHEKQASPLHLDLLIGVFVYFVYRFCKLQGLTLFPIPEEQKG